MSRRQNRITRAQRQGGVILSPAQIQALIAQANAAPKKGKRTQDTGKTMFTPGIPLDPQPGINPQGRPIQWDYMPAYNVSGVDRSMNNPDIPSYAQLRTLARMYSGVGLCERVWSDMVPKLAIQVQLKPQLVEQGANEKKYQKKIAQYLTFFEKPDGIRDQHSWLRMALKEQTQIDELYIYKRRQRGGGLYSLEIISGETMKPLLDLWGRIPQPPDAAYQQFPRGIPGAQFTAADMIHYNESPSADTPYGFSRVERIILEVNQALRKKRQDLARYTDGNIPSGIMEVPEAGNWTPDQIDAYEQMWNALIAGNQQQQVRIKFTQPGMKYTAFDSTPIDSAFDQFLLNICTAAYGVSMADISFTGDIHKSSDDGQQNMLFRRTLYPIVSMYANILTGVLRDDFGENDLEVVFSGFEEAEDLGTLATAYSTLANVGAIAPSDIAQIMKLPEVPKTGPFILGKTGPIFLEDLKIGSQLREAQTTSQIAGLQAAADPQQQGDDGEQADDAATEAEKSLGRFIVPDLERIDPVHDSSSGEFGFYANKAVHPGKGKGKGHGAHKKGKGKKKAHVSAAVRLQKMSARFGKLEARKLGKHWSASQRTAAGALEKLFSQIAGNIRSGNRGAIDSALSHAWSQAKRLFAGNSKGLGAMSRSLNHLDVANEKGTLRAAESEPMEEEDDMDEETDDDRETEVFDELEEVLMLLEQEEEDRAGESEDEEALRREVSAEYRRWRQRTLDDVKAGRPLRTFTTDLIPEEDRAFLRGELARCTTAEEVRVAFRAVDSFGAWQRTDHAIQQMVRDLKAKGIERITWRSHPGCDNCIVNDKHERALGATFPNGCVLPPAHPHCECDYTVVTSAPLGAMSAGAK